MILKSNSLPINFSMHPDHAAISNSLITFIKENLLAENINITSETSFESLGLDSFSIIEIILFIERKFGLELPDRALTKENVYSASALALCVQQYLSQK